LITTKTKVIIVQNTFGLSPDLDPILELAKKNNLVVIEDCAHGLGASYKGRPAGTITDASFFSTQWSKPISTGLGGMAYVSNKDIAKRVTDFQNEIPNPSIVEQLMLMAQWIVRPLADHPTFHYKLIDGYRWLTQKVGLSIGSSVGEELDSIMMPRGYLKRMGALPKWHLEREFTKLDAVIKNRQQAAQYYDNYFSSKKNSVPFRPEYASHAMLRYPIRVSNKPEFLENARRKRIPVGDWFVSSLHPVERDLDQWGYQIGSCPEAERACSEVINLFTDNPLTIRQLDVLFD
jgi:perosamine synthetase